MHMNIGAHVSTNGGLITAVDRAKTIGAECIQCFSHAPQQWQGRGIEAHVGKQFIKTCQANVLFPVFIHGAYLINILSDDDNIVRRSTQSLIDDLHYADAIGAMGVIFHIGSAKKEITNASEIIASRLSKILDSTDTKAKLILENSAGSGYTAGSTLKSLKLIADYLPPERTSFCIDTQHAFASGYDLSSSTGIHSFIEEVQTTITWDRVDVIHLNDSKTECGSHRDRHENIGSGFIGAGSFKTLLNNKRLKDKAILLEVPGFDHKGPDKKNIDLVRSLFA